MVIRERFTVSNIIDDPHKAFSARLVDLQNHSAWYEEGMKNLSMNSKGRKAFKEFRRRKEEIDERINEALDYAGISVIGELK